MSSNITTPSPVRVRFVDLTPSDHLAKDDDKTPTSERSRQSRSASLSVVSGSPTKKLKPSSGRVERRPPNPRTHFRKFSKWAMNKGGFTVGDVKEVFRLYDWQKARHEQDPEVLDRIEVLLKLKDAPWPCSETRSRILGDKVRDILKEALGRFGWIQDSGYREDSGKMKMRFGPVNPKKPRTTGLPQWLPLDFLNLDPDDPPIWDLKHLTLECKTGTIQSGSGLYQKSEDLVHLGTMGAVVENEEISQHFVLAAAHVIGDGTTVSRT